jgi:hypothetical protein
MTDTPKQVIEEEHGDAARRAAEGNLGSCCSSSCCAPAGVESAKPADDTNT